MRGEWCNPMVGSLFSVMPTCVYQEKPVCLAWGGCSFSISFVLTPPWSNMKSPSQSFVLLCSQMPHSFLSSPSNFVHMPPVAFHCWTQSRAGPFPCSVVRPNTPFFFNHIVLVFPPLSQKPDKLSFAISLERVGNKFTRTWSYCWKWQLI